ncbi:hypothetical protein B0J11DRAFT_517236 [Dendryphion nanum]|uniref:Uncharacterized protein n=1 Tax=Dendryphion nanum TaxID=256645 RepID=A0A9P9ECI3_9PLEO|nr:hypothetical protein B0J11DRAFT_517236 [Dendryphion nanum]
MKFSVSLLAALIATVAALPNNPSPVEEIAKRACVVPAGCTAYNAAACEYCCRTVPSETQCHIDNPIVACRTNNRNGVVYHCETH